jgi:SAM-dependent methyltransferase
MPRLFRNHSLGSAFQRLSRLVRGVGVLKTFSLMVSYMDDLHLRLFDRRYGVKTSGYISLASTSFAADRLPDATAYAPVNGWAFRKLLQELNLPRSLHFVDLGCGLGRACILAGEYGFEKIIGVELASELCSMARKNIASCRLPAGKLSAIEICQMDAMDFCTRTDDDVFFMFRPFKWAFLISILDKLVERATSLGKPMVIIYSERMMHDDSYARAFSENRAFRKVREAGMYGQAFFIYECGTHFARIERGPAVLKV